MKCSASSPLRNVLEASLRRSRNPTATTRAATRLGSASLRLLRLVFSILSCSVIGGMLSRISARNLIILYSTQDLRANVRHTPQCLFIDKVKPQPSYALRSPLLPRSSRVGQVPIRDFFSYHPGRYYWSAMLFKLLRGRVLSGGSAEKNVSPHLAITQIPVR